MPPKRRAKKRVGGDEEPTPAPIKDIYAPIRDMCTIQGGSDSKYLVFDFTNDTSGTASVLADNASLLYMKGGIKSGTLSLGKGNQITSFFGRVFSGETAFLQTYSGNGIVALGSSLPGDIIMLRLEPGHEYFLSSGSYVACTENVRISGAFNALGLISWGQEEGPALPHVSVVDDSIGYVWIGGYGAFERHDIPENETMLVNNGLFLASTKKYDGIRRMGKTLLSSAFGEGLGMEFIGPCIVYTQSKNSNVLVDYIATQLPKPSNNTSNGISLLGNFTSESSEGGADKSKNKKKIKKVKNNQR